MAYLVEFDRVTKLGEQTVWRLDLQEETKDLIEKLTKELKTATDLLELYQDKMGDAAEEMDKSSKTMVRAREEIQQLKQSIFDHEKKLEQVVFDYEKKLEQVVFDYEKKLVDQEWSDRLIERMHGTEWDDEYDTELYDRMLDFETKDEA